MGTLTRIYWMRFVLGIFAGFICTLYNIYIEHAVVGNISAFMTGVMLGILIYLLSYYAFKYAYFTKVEKPVKLFTTGIGIYFITWIVFWTLFWSIYYILYLT